MRQSNEVAGHDRDLSVNRGNEACTALMNSKGRGSVILRKTFVSIGEASDDRGYKPRYALQHLAHTRDQCEKNQMGFQPR
jgi:hypothetical protein